MHKHMGFLGFPEGRSFFWVCHFMLAYIHFQEWWVRMNTVGEVPAGSITDFLMVVSGSMAFVNIILWMD